MKYFKRIHSKLQKYTKSNFFLSYDLIGLVYYLLINNDFKTNENLFIKKNKFKGKIGIFEINKKTITHQLNFYEIQDKSLKKFFNFFKSFCSVIILNFNFDSFDQMLIFYFQE